MGFFVVDMKSALLSFLFVFIYLVCSCQGVGYTIKYYGDSICAPGSKRAERSFEVGTCYDLAYNDGLLSHTSCDLSSECFLEVYQDDADSCPDHYSFNATTVLTGLTGIRANENSGDTCDARRGIETTEYDFGICLPSTIYQNCYYTIQLGSVVDDDDGNSAHSLLPLFVLSVLSLVILV